MLLSFIGYNMLWYCVVNTTTGIYEMRISPTMIIFIISIIAIELLFVRLGFWQYQRMIEKDNIKQAFMANIEQRTMSVHGKFDHSREVVLESQKHNNLYGYRILTPLVMENNQEVIIDRGWVPRSFREGFLGFYKTKGEVNVIGVRRLQPVLRQKWFKGPVEGVGAATVLQLLRLDKIPQQQGLKRADYYIQATSQTHDGVAAFFAEPTGGEKHKEYMLTWFLFAVIMPLLFLGLWLAKRKQRVV